ncbi:MAG: glucuronate isomerase [Solobacterium sp.]|nr:glucuronate isomerase [Solobacterium sp.]
MGRDFLLQNETAKHLYHDYAERLPIIDYHCHIPQQEIYEDRKFENIAQVWLGGHQKRADGSDYYFGDHYKWRLMRANGVSEDYITGDKPDRERFQKFAETLEKTIGNPMNHWCQLELEKYFGYTKPINGANAQEIWDLCNDRLQNDPNCTVRGLIRSSNVYFVGTTDDPVDSLEWHQKIKDDPTIDITVAPSFRPDKALNVHLAGFDSYIKQLAAVSETEITGADSALAALEKRLKFFVSLGCKASDHGIEEIPNTGADASRADVAFQKAMNGEPVSEAERRDWQSYLMEGLGRMYHDSDVAMQLHYNAIRNTNQKLFELYGPDTGFDAMDAHNCVHGIQGLLSNLFYTDQCPKTILYSLNPSDMDLVATIAGCFQANSDVPTRVQLGAAWWFNDTKDGMVRHLQILGRLGVLGNFIGMLTDSRSFLSYTRHEYFRRILCNTIGQWVEDGEFPNDDAALKTIVEGICFYNAKTYFSL